MICDRCIFKGRTDSCTPAQQMAALMGAKECEPRRVSIFFHEFYQKYPDIDIRILDTCKNMTLTQGSLAAHYDAEQYLKDYGIDRT